MSTIKYCIGIVEDCPITGHSVQWQLSRNPRYEVQLYASGEDLLHCQQNVPDILVVDYHLDSENEHAMTGIEVADHFHSIPCIIMSQEKEITRALHCIRHGACDYVVKSDQLANDIDQSLNQIVDHLEMNRLRQKSKTDLSRMTVVLSAVILLIVLSAGIG